MPPLVQNSISPAELAFLHSSLSLNPPIRPDARAANQFRPLVAESNILPGTNGSARICFADGTEAVVGVKAEVERSKVHVKAVSRSETNEKADEERRRMQTGQSQWIEMSIEIPGQRDDDPLPVFLSAMLHESLVAGGELAGKLFINPNWHWKLYIDILLLSPPLSYPVPLLSLTTHLALLSTRLPALKSEQDEDPFFDDDWDASEFIYPASEPTRPSITLLVASVGQNILFDPSREEIAVADTLLAVSVSKSIVQHSIVNGELRLLSVRTIDSPSRVTPAGVLDSENTKTLASGMGTSLPPEPSLASFNSNSETIDGLWKSRRGGIPRRLVTNVIDICLAQGGVGDEILAALQTVEAS